MTQPSRRARFAFEALDKLVVAHELRRDQLQGDVTLRAEVSGQVHRSHPAFSQQVFEAVLIVKHLSDVLFNSRHELPMLPQLFVTNEIQVSLFRVHV